jgi:hypothetical protein
MLPCSISACARIDNGAFRGPGSEFRLAAGRRNLEARVDVRLTGAARPRRWSTPTAEVAGTVPLAADRMSARGSVTVPFETSGWLLLRALGGQAGLAGPRSLSVPASTSPVYVRIGEQEPAVAGRRRLLRSSGWTGSSPSAKARRDWNTEDERADVMATLDEARRRFIALGGRHRPMSTGPG